MRIPMITIVIDEETEVRLNRAQRDEIKRIILRVKNARDEVLRTSDEYDAAYDNLFENPSKAKLPMYAKRARKFAGAALRKARSIRRWAEAISICNERVEDMKKIIRKEIDEGSANYGADSEGEDLFIKEVS